MTRFEYLQLRDMLEAFTQRRISKISLDFLSWFFIVLFAVGLGVCFYVSSNLKTITEISSYLKIQVIFFFSLILFIILVILIFSYKNSFIKEESFKLLVKLGESWEAGKSVEETLALPEFAKLFPKKPRIGGIEFV